MRLASLLLAGLLALPIAAAAADEGVRPQEDPSTEADVETTKYDRGIYLPMPDDTRSVCGKIVSYNFTEDENPELKNVTTCTPFHRPAIKRARRPAPKQEPHLESTSQPAPQD